ncbi:helix-turn-helix domain-containing protein [Fictibacillus nanhaiensis]|uniref:Helix-turn-helix domain-containing protein n=1 Tax=Fictibacillus nanhaiensis TaxID=742169 RepID=A0ABS2ZK88_9BACL|nr:helix-turn-helix domain-containing protein [Fictibacillus nanhaiensis]
MNFQESKDENKIPSLKVIKTNRYSSRKAYQCLNKIIYLDCIHCGVTEINNFGEDYRGFMGKRSECTPCRRRTKDARNKIGSKVKLSVSDGQKEFTYYLVSQARRYAFKDSSEEIYFICTVCEKVKEINEFYNETGSLLNKKSSCKNCTDKKNDKWKLDNTHRYLETHRKYYYKNREEIRKQVKKFRDENKQHIYLQKKAFRERHREKLYFKKKNYREKNKEKERMRIKKWFENNPLKQRFYSQLRLARKKALPDTLTEKQLSEILARYNNLCCLTGAEADLDHVIPLFIGHGGTTYENILPLSKVLNGSKQDKNIFEWAKLVHKDFGFTMERFKKVINEISNRNGMTYEEYEKYYNWCFDNPQMQAKFIIRNRKLEQEAFLIKLEEAIKMYTKGFAIKEIEREVGITRNTIYRHIKKRGMRCNRRERD